MPQNTELASKLLRDAAGFFRTTAENNAATRKEMAENAQVFEQLAGQIENDPRGSVKGKPFTDLAASLLQDASGFFNTVADQNPKIREQMQENAKIFRQIGDVMLRDPFGWIDDDPTLKPKPSQAPAAPEASPFYFSRRQDPHVTDDPPLPFSLSYPTRVLPTFWRSVGQTEGLVDFRRAIFRRDFHACLYCGLQSRKYHEIVAQNGIEWDLSRVATVCLFCAQCLMLDVVPKQRSGVLVLAPEITQTHLHAAFRVVYVCRIFGGPAAQKAKELLDSLMERRQGARDQLGSDDPLELVRMMNSAETPEELAALRRKLEGIRLVPLDRRIVRTADLEFNQFPQILAYWRSKNGPYGKYRPPSMNLEELDRILSILAPATVHA